MEFKYVTNFLNLAADLSVDPHFFANTLSNSGGLLCFEIKKPIDLTMVIKFIKIANKSKIYGSAKDLADICSINNLLLSQDLINDLKHGDYFNSKELVEKKVKTDNLKTDDNFKSNEQIKKKNKKVNIDKVNIDKKSKRDNMIDKNPTATGEELTDNPKKISSNVDTKSQLDFNKFMVEFNDVKERLKQISEQKNTKPHFDNSKDNNPKELVDTTVNNIEQKISVEEQIKIDENIKIDKEIEQIKKDINRYVNTYPKTQNGVSIKKKILARLHLLLVEQLEKKDTLNK